MNKKNGPPICPKSGIKIHETPNQNQGYTQGNTQSNQTQSQGKNISFHKTTLSELDLNIDNYTLDDLYNLFNISFLDESSLKTAKQIVLKMHPDKSQLDSKYFLFFSKAYKRVYSIYEFQNKSEKKNERDLKKDYFEDSNKTVLDTMFATKKELKDPNNFNSWFNEKFEKHKLEDDDTNKGYGDWLKTDEGIYGNNDNVTQSNMNEAFELQKKQIQALTVYNGINDTYAAFSGGGSLLGDQSSNFSGSSAGLGFTDLRQAHIETIIPITQDDYEKIPKYKNLNEYKTNRDRVDITPISKVEAERILHQNKNNLDQESAALAYKYAKEAEKAKAKQRSFWGDIKQLL
uniref:J domain-containing protein n=1 Tax=viral metagenome TaxID=1070528 RepID=A0A6C0I8Q0_9ZZZZ